MKILLSTLVALAAMWIPANDGYRLKQTCPICFDCVPTYVEEYDNGGRLLWHVYYCSRIAWPRVLFRVECPDSSKKVWNWRVHKWEWQDVQCKGIDWGKIIDIKCDTLGLWPKCDTVTVIDTSAIRRVE